MSMNFLGLGFNFGAKDDGLEKAQKGYTRGFADMTDSTGEFNEALKGINSLYADSPLTDFINTVDEDSERLKDAWKPVDETFYKSFDSIEDRAEVFARKSAPGLMGAFDKMASKAKSAFGGAASNFQKFDKVVSPATDKISGGLSAIGKAGSAISSGFGRVGSTMMTFFKKGGDGAKKLVSGFSDVAGILVRLDKLVGMSRLQTFLQGAMFEKLKGIAEKIKAIGTEGINLTTGFEAHMQSLGASARKASANLGLTGKELNKVTGAAAGMAHGMNISTEAAADAVYSFSKAQTEFAAAGIDSAVTLAKFTDVTGMSATALRESLLKARKELHFDDAQIKLVTGSFMSMGQAIGNVPAAMQDMPQVLDMMSELKSWGVTDTKVLASFAAQTAALAKGFKETGQGADAARATSMALTKAIIDSKSQISKMFAGTADDLSQFTQELGISTGDISEAFKLMQEGPEGMTTGLAKMVLSMKKQGKDVTKPLEFLHARLESAIGPEAAKNLTNFLSGASEETLSMMSAAKQAGTSLGKFAKEGWASTKTLQDAFEDTKNSFISNFRSIGRKAAVEFVHDTGVEFNKFTKQLKGIAAEGGPLGAIVTKFSEMHQIGVMALLPKTLRPMATLFGTMAEQLLPMAAQLGALGFRFNMLVSPVSLLVIGVGLLVGWFVKLRLEGKSTADALDNISAGLEHFSKVAVQYAGKALDWLVGLTDRLLDSLSGKGGGQGKTDTAWSKFFSMLLQGAKRAFGMAVEGFLDVFQVMMDVVTGKHPQAKTRIGHIVGNLAEIAKLLAGKFVDAVKSVDWIHVIKTVGTALVTVMTKAVQFLIAEAPKVWAFYGKLFNGLLEMLGGNQVKELIMAIAKAIPKYAAVVGKALFGMLGSAMDFIVKHGPEYAVIVGNALLDLLSKGVDLLADEFPKITAQIFDELGKAFAVVGSEGGDNNFLFDWIISAVDAVARSAAKIGEALMYVMDQAFVFIAEADIGGIITNILKMLLKALGKVFDALLPFIRVLITQKLPRWFNLITDAIVKFVTELPEKLSMLVSALGDFLKEQLPKIIPVILDNIWMMTKLALVGIPLLIWKVIKKIPDIIVGIYDLTLAAFKLLFWTVPMGILKGVVNWLGDFLGPAITKPFKEAAEWISGFFTRIFNALGDIINKGIKSIYKALGVELAESTTKSAGLVNGLGEEVKKTGDKSNKALTDSFDATAKSLDGSAADMTKSFEAAGTNIEKGFGASMDNTVKLASDANEKMGDSTKSMSEGWMKSLLKVMTPGVPKAFDGGFKPAKSNTVMFLKEETDLFQKFLDGLQSAFESTFMKILTATSLVMKAIGNEITLVLGQLKSIEVQMDIMRKAESAAKAKEAELRKKTDEFDPKFDAVRGLQETLNEPKWYEHFKANSGNDLSAIRENTAKIAATIQSAPNVYGAKPGSFADNAKKGVDNALGPTFKKP